MLSQQGHIQALLITPVNSSLTVKPVHGDLHSTLTVPMETTPHCTPSRFRFPLPHFHSCLSFLAAKVYTRSEWHVLILLTLFYLLPLWAFKYVPTHDGPLHLANAVIVKNYGNPHTRYHEFYEIHWRLLPNVCSQVLLVVLLYVVPPLVAEKLLLSLYVVGFAGSIRFFLKSFDGSASLLAPIALLFVYNFCFFFGFYNYSLVLVLYFVTLGFILRCTYSISWLKCLMLALLLFLSYITHLLGLILSAVSTLWLVVALSSKRWQTMLFVLCASAAPLALAIHDFLEPDLLGIRETQAEQLEEWPHILKAWMLELDDLPHSAKVFGGYLFGDYPPDLPIAFFALMLYNLLIVSTVWAGQTGKESHSWIPLVALGCSFCLLQYLIRDSLSQAIGFLKARVAILVPILVLPAFRLPAAGLGRRVLLMAVYLVVVTNLVVVFRHFQSENRELEEYVRGVSIVHNRGTLFVCQPGRKRASGDCLAFAANYYCIDSQMVNLDNFQATLRHFLVRYRPGIARGYGDLDTYEKKAQVEVILAWDLSAFSRDVSFVGFRRVFTGGRLALFEREQKADGE